MASFDFDTIVESVNGNYKQGIRERIKERVVSYRSSFKDAISKNVTKILTDNIDYLAQVVITNDPHGSAYRRENVLQRALEHPKSRKYIKAIKRIKKYINWDSYLFTQAILETMIDYGIQFNHSEQSWLLGEVERFRLYIYQ